LQPCDGAGLARLQVRAAGKWSTLEVVCHIGDCKQFFADRMKRTVAMERPLLLGADGFRYLERLSYQEHDLVPKNARDGLDMPIDEI
jgi:hypothetical protein